jgi:hypothetical protein
MPTTSNFGWTTPADTDLVKDGAAAIRTLGNGIDTSFLDLKGGTTDQVLAKNSNADLDFKWVADASGIPATIFDAKGDLIAASAADTAARLAVGANNTVLTADSSTGTGLKWAAPAAAASNFTLLNSGGTALTGAATITVSGISGINFLHIFIYQASSVNASAAFTMRFNGDTGNNYLYGIGRFNAASTYDADSFNATSSDSASSIPLGRISTDSASHISGVVTLNGCNAAGIKIINLGLGGTRGTGYDQIESFGGGVYTGSSTISSVSLISSTGNFDGGTIYVYGA